jgi:hypothetical protein
LNATAETFVKFVPVIVTLVPTTPLVGANAAIVGGTNTTNGVALVAVPSDVTTVITPVVAPVGTVAVSCVALFTVNVAATPLNRTAVTLFFAATGPGTMKFVPVIVTLVPTTPLVGVNAVIVGGNNTVKIC